MNQYRIELVMTANHTALYLSLLNRRPITTSVPHIHLTVNASHRKSCVYAPASNIVPIEAFLVSLKQSLF